MLRPSRFLLTVATIATVLVGAVGIAGATIGVWEPATQTPDTSILAPGASAAGSELMCTAVGDCTAVGRYDTGNNSYQGYVAQQTGGTWGAAVAIPDLAALNVGNDIQFTASSCSPAGACVVVGTYDDANAHSQGYLYEIGSVGAVSIPSLLAANDWDANVTDISCPSTGECTVVGWYSDVAGITQPFTLDQTAGVWGSIAIVPSLPVDLVDARLLSVSCWAAGECVAVGTMDSDGLGYSRPITVRRSGGVWATAQAFDITPLGQGRGLLRDVVCVTGPNCVSIGIYTSFSNWDVLTVSMTDGIWGTPAPLPGIAALTVGGYPDTVGLACWSVGNCFATGFGKPAGLSTPWIAEMTGGTWSTATVVPGLAALSGGTFALPNDLACSPEGDCAVTGQYQIAFAQGQSFVVDRFAGSITDAIDIPGLNALNTGLYSVPRSVACVSGGCQILGFFSTVYPAGLPFTAALPLPTTTTSTTSTTSTSTTSTTVAPTSTTAPVDPTTTTAADEPVAPAFTG